MSQRCATVGRNTPGRLGASISGEWMRRILTACLLLQFAAAPGASAQEPFETEHLRRLAENPEGVSLTVTVENGRRRFAMGEIVRLQLSFSSQIPDTYQLDPISYDRSGRLNVDLPTVTPAASAVDPLEDYYGAGLFAFVGGGISTPPSFLGPDPVSLSLVLNEHLRFERPGRFRLFVVSRRVHPAGRYAGLSVTSNVIDLEIVEADPAVQQRQIAAALAVLRDDSDTTRLDAACQVLRFQGTAGAVDAILDEYHRPAASCRSTFSLGLNGVPPPLRAYAARAMLLRLRDPRYPVGSRFLPNLAFLTYLTQHPDYAVSAGTPLAAHADRRNAYERILDRCVEDLAVAVAAKEGRALAVSAMTLIAHIRSQGAPETVQRHVEGLWTRLPPVFGLLSTEDQQALLEYEWRVIRHPDLLPALRQILAQPAGAPGRGDRVRDAALRRLYELAPAEGRQRILEEISNGNSTLDAVTLGALPDTTLPELDDELMTQLETSASPGSDLPSLLLARYASASVLPRALRRLRSWPDNGPCRSRHPLLAYVLRVSPDDGLDLIRDALSRRNGCFTNVLKRVADLHADPGLTALAVEALEDPDPEVVGNAAETLRDYGTAAARDALWRQLTHWHEESLGRDDRPSESVQWNQQWWVGWRLQTVLALALAEGHGWRLELEELNRVRDHVHDSVKAELDRHIEQVVQEPRISVRRDPVDGVAFSVDPYRFGGSLERLQQKLVQFPAGTVFGWRSHLPPGWEADDAELFARVQQFLQQRGLDLVRTATR